MRILILDAYYKPENIAFTHLENDLIDGFVAAGYEIDIICPVPTRGVDKETIKKYKDRKCEKEYGGKVRVHRFWAPQERRNPVIRAFRYAWCNFKTYQMGKKFKQTDVIFANSTPPTQGWLAGKLKKKLGCSFLYCLQDIFPDSLVSAGLTHANSCIWKIGRLFENSTYKNADKIVVISEEFKENVIAKANCEGKIRVIPNWVNVSNVYPVERNENILFNRYLLNPEDFYVCYSGNIGHSQNLELLIEVAERLKTELPDCKIIMIGEGAAKEEFSSKIRKKNLNNIVLLPFQPYKDIAYVFSLGDAGLVISKSGVGVNSVPSKTWSIMAAHRPVIASFDEQSELNRLIREKRCGIAVKADDCELLVNAIKFLHDNTEIKEAFGENGNKYILEELNSKKCVSAYIEQLNEIAGRKYL